MRSLTNTWGHKYLLLDCGPYTKVIKCNRLEALIIKMARNSTLKGFNCCLSLYLWLTIDNRGLKRKS